MAEHTDPNTGKTIKHYLVKWRSMQYEDSTWELEEDVDPVKIQQYENNSKRPPKEKWKVKFYNFNSFMILCFFNLCHSRALSVRWICPLNRLKSLRHFFLTLCHLRHCTPTCLLSAGIT